jgi:hypothetical protein
MTTPKPAPKRTPKAIAKTAAAKPAAAKPAVDAGPELRPGYVVFYDGFVFGETKPGTFAGIVLACGHGRARVHTLGLATESADFPSDDLRLNA